MQISGENSLIIVGAWNPAILNPQWICHEILGLPEGEEMPIQMEFAAVPGAPPRVTIDDVTYIPAMDRLNLYPKEFSVEKLTSVENQASRILEILPHTPIQAFGQNFEFIEQEPSADQMRIFDLQGNRIQECEFVQDQRSVDIKQSYSLDDCILNINQISQEGSLIVKFNFHYEVENADEARQRLGNTFSRNLRRAIEFLELYDAVPDGLNLAEILEERVG